MPATLGTHLFLLGQQFVSLLPDGASSLRYEFYRRYMRAGGRFNMMSGGRIYGPEHVSIGAGSSMNVGVLIDACDGGDIVLGDNVMVGPYCVLRAADHCFTDVDVPIRRQGHLGGHIVIEEDCWLGSHVVVTRNVRIGRGSVIGAHSVVTHDLPPYSVAMGAPARVVRSRRPDAASEVQP